MRLIFVVIYLHVTFNNIKVFKAATETKQWLCTVSSYKIFRVILRLENYLLFTSENFARF